MVRFVYYMAEWCGPCKMYWPKVLAWATEWDVALTKVDLSDGFVDGIQTHCHRSYKSPHAPRRSIRPTAGFRRAEI